MRKRILRALCALRRGHDERCSIFLDGTFDTQHHIHVCARCQTVTIDKTTPIESDIIALLSAMTPIYEPAIPELPKIETPAKSWVN